MRFMVRSYREAGARWARSERETGVRRGNTRVTQSSPPPRACFRRHKRTKVTPVLLAKSAYISSKSFAEFLGEKKIALSFYALILLLLSD